MPVQCKKVLFFIVEGISDEETLYPIFKNYFKDNKVHFYVVHGDLSAEKEITATNIIKIINSRIKEEMNRYGYKKSDIERVIHFTDTDGSFVSDANIVFQEKKDLWYTKKSIQTNHVDKILERNRRKSSSLKKLASTNTIGGVPYHIYYFSRNMEHVLHNNELLLMEEDKMNRADEFAEAYEDNPGLFKKYVSEAEFSVNGDYKTTWNFIMQKENSLKRFSNIHLCL